MDDFRHIGQMFVPADGADEALGMVSPVQS